METDQGLFLRMSAFVSTLEPGTVIHSIDELAKFPRDSYDAWVLSALQYGIGFNFALTTTNSYGELNTDTQSWDGQIGLLINNTVDLGISTFAMTPAQYDVVDFSYPLGLLPAFMAFYRRPSFALDSWALAKPFRANLWLSISILVVIISFLFASILLSKNPCHESRATWRRAICAVYSGFLWSVEVLLLKGDCSANFGKAIVVLFLTLSPTAVMVHEAYNGMLLSFLTVPPDPFKRLDQLMAVHFKFALSSKLEFVADDLEANLDTNGFKKSVQKLSKDPIRFLDVKKEVLAGPFAFICMDFHGYTDMQDNFTPTERASIAQLPLAGGRTVMHGLMLPKGSPHKRLINNQILKLRQSGITLIWSTRLRVGRPDSTSADPLPHPQISFVSTLVATVLFICGAVAAAFLFLCETLCVRNVPGNT